MNIEEQLRQDLKAAMRGGETIKDAATLSFDTVASVTTSAKDGVKLNLPTKGIVIMADIKQIL